ncbi:MAG: hypothetical protein CSA53_06770 [Gammaproteobacteria bacterium]|nr:MAG: hypothetical protein CSA53_06770 [Gammaproteobacteria bacterium]
MGDIHIHDFYHDTARALVLLYSSFPRPITLYVDDVCGPDEPDEFGLPSPRFEAGFGAMLWLANEGFIRFDSTIRQEALDQAVLNERGFVLLASSYELAPKREPSTPPGLHHEQQTGAAWLRKALKTRDSARLQETMLTLLGGNLAARLDER